MLETEWWPPQALLHSYFPSVNPSRYNNEENTLLISIEFSKFYKGSLLISQWLVFLPRLWCIRVCRCYITISLLVFEMMRRMKGGDWPAVELRICLYSCSACAGFDCALDSACFRRAGVVDDVVWVKSIGCSLGYVSSDIGCPFRWPCASCTTNSWLDSQITGGYDIGSQKLLINILRECIWSALAAMNEQRKVLIYLYAHEQDPQPTESLQKMER